MRICFKYPLRFYTEHPLYKNSSKDIRKIAKELNVGNVLEGSVRKSGNQVRITAQLINAVDGSHLWAQNYDRALKDIFKLQDEVSQKIAESLQVAVGNQIIDTAQKTKPQNIEAYKYYLKAKYVCYNKFYASNTETDWAEAIHYAEKSIENDREYSLAYSMLSTLYAHRNWYSNNQEYLKKAEHYANLASQIEPSITETLRAKFWIHFIKSEYDQSFNLIKKMIDDNPNDFENNYLLEMFYNRVGMPHDLIKYSTRAIELNPLNFDVYGDRASGYRLIGDKENHIRDVRICLSLQPESSACKLMFARYLLWINDLHTADKYIAELEQAELEQNSITLPGTQIAIKGLRAIYYAKLGKKEQALVLFPNGPGIYAELGMAHEAVPLILESLKSSMYGSFPSYEILLHSPFYEHIRNAPEFQHLLAQQKPISDEMIRKYRIK